MLGVSWLEIAVVAVLIGLLIGTGRVASLVRGVRRGMRDDDPQIRVRFVERGPDTEAPSDSGERREG